MDDVVDFRDVEDVDSDTIDARAPSCDFADPHCFLGVGVKNDSMTFPLMSGDAVFCSFY